MCYYAFISSKSTIFAGLDHFFSQIWPSSHTKEFLAAILQGYLSLQLFQEDS